jgi:hypothetical protein
MTESQLWISEFPDRVLGEVSHPADMSLVPEVAERYLQAIPYAPTSRMWFFWQVSAIDPNRYQWVLDRFFNGGWPPELGIATIQPLLISRMDDLSLRITVRNDSANRRGEAIQDSVLFDCYIYRDLGQAPGELALEANNWLERLSLVEQAIKHLLKEGS